MRTAKPTIVRAPAKPQVTTEDPELADRFNRVLTLSAEAMEESGLHYAFIGGIASGGLGRPRSTRDIDLFVAPEDAELALRALAAKGFRTEKTDPSWLYKAFRDDILVDVIFKSKGEIYLDAEMHRRTITREWHGRLLRLVAPEDLLIIKAAAHGEQTPNHWHDAIGILSHANLDWDYLIQRARRAPRRVLSLFLYAQSNDVWVPNQVIHELYQSVFGNLNPERRPGEGRPLHAGEGSAARAPLPPSLLQPSSAHAHAHAPAPAPNRALHPHQMYNIGHLHQALAEDSRTHELDIQIEAGDEHILLRGEVPQPERRLAIEALTREFFPGHRVENQIRVLEVISPSEEESLK